MLFTELAPHQRLLIVDQTIADQQMAPERSDERTLTIRSSGRNYEREVIQVRIPAERDRDNANNGRIVENPVKDPIKAPPPEVVSLNQFSVDREKTCPLLLRVFCNVGRHYSMAEFQHGNTPSGELQIYTWMDATLKELTGLIRDVHPDARRRGTYFEFNLVFPDNRTPGYRCKKIGTTRNGERGQEDNQMLADVRFQIGDFMSVAITPPERPF